MVSFVRFICVISAGCQAISLSAAAPRSTQPQSTIEMVSRLQALDRDMDIVGNTYESRHRAFMYGRLAGEETDPMRKLELTRLHALELLNAGESLAAVARFKDVVALEDQLADRTLRENLRATQVYTAMAWLRLGEQENCITNHTTESCLLPIAGNGVHRLPRGSTEALGILNEVVEADPYRLDARWLLNLAHMTLGSYPDGVPAKWLVPPSRFASDYDIRRFTDAAGDLGVDGNQRAGGTVLEDFNNDGRLDILVSGWGLDDPLHFYVAQANGTYVEQTEAAGLKGLTSGLNLVQADYNNDGFMDVLILRGAWLGRIGRVPNSLLHNNGDGTFRDVTIEAGLGVARPTQTAVWFDYNGDGLLDLFIGNESLGAERHRSELFRNQGDGTFKECSFESGLAIFAMVKGVAAGDFNRDGRPDLFLSIMGEPNRLLRNDGPAPPGDPLKSWKFTDVSATAGIEGPLKSFPCWFFDYDNDGWEDIFVAGYNLLELDDAVAEIMGRPTKGDLMALYRNRGDGTFENVAKAARLSRSVLAMGANFGDLDNDGWLDLYIGTGNPDLRTLVPNKMYRNAGGEFFQDVTTSGGFGHLQKGHAIAFGDLDNDGDQDVYANMGGAYTGDVYRNALFENPGHGNRWLKLKLEGVTSNRSAIGAKLKVVVKTPAGERAIYKTVNSGGSFGANPLRQELGLGDALTIDRVEVFWPATGKTQILQGLAMDAAYHVKEGEKLPGIIDLAPAPFKRLGQHTHHHH